MSRKPKFAINCCWVLWPRFTGDGLHVETISCCWATFADTCERAIHYLHSMPRTDGHITHAAQNWSTQDSASLTLGVSWSACPKSNLLGLWSMACEAPTWQVAHLSSRPALLRWRLRHVWSLMSTDFLQACILVPCRSLSRNICRPRLQEMNTNKTFLTCCCQRCSCCLGCCTCRWHCCHRPRHRRCCTYWFVMVKCMWLKTSKSTYTGASPARA